MARDRDSESAASSEEEGDESEYETDSEPEPIQTAPAAAPLPQKVRSESPEAQQQHKSSSSEETDSESGSDSEETSQEIPPPAPKPVASVQKPNHKQKAASAEPSLSEHRTPEGKAAGTKRGAEEKGISAKDAKKAKKMAESTDSKISSSSGKVHEPDSKKLFQRIWSEDDEMVILKGMADYMETKKVDANSEIDSFHDFIKDKLQVDVNRSQLQSKIRRLKKKFITNKSKEVQGEDRVFSKPHEHMSYQLSKKVWSKEHSESSVASPSAVKKPKTKSGALEENKTVATSSIVDSEKVANGVETLELTGGMASAKTPGKDHDTVLPNLNFAFQNDSVHMEVMVQRIGSEFFDEGKLVEGAREWRDIRLKEIELHWKFLQIKMEKTKLVMDALKSRNV